MPRVALVQDGTEVARQQRADVAGFLDVICRDLSEGDAQFELSIHTDDSVDFLLDGLRPDEYSCIVIASNALLSTQVARAFRRYRSVFMNYLSGSGGLVLLHQQLDDLSIVLPEAFDCEFVDRRSFEDGSFAKSEYGDDVLLNYPYQVALGSVGDGLQSVGPRPLHWKSFDRDSLQLGLKPVINVNTAEVVIARSVTRTPERIVLSSIPLDWRRSKELLSNSISYAARGKPRRLLWRSGESRMHMLERWLQSDPGTAVRPIPYDEPIPETDTWLLREVDLCVLPQEAFERSRRLEAVDAFLKQGGVLASSQVRSDGSSLVSAIVGGHLERKLTEMLHLELLAVRGWASPKYAFELRNIVSALRFLEGASSRLGFAASTDDFNEIADEVRTRLADPHHREDFGSSIALAQTAVLLGGARDAALDELTIWMEEVCPKDHLDLVALVRAIRTRIAGEDFEAIFELGHQVISEHLRLESSGMPALARVLDAVAFLSETGEMPNGRYTVQRFCLAVAEYLDKVPATRAQGWLSVEATADVVRGLSCLIGSLEETVAVRQRLVEHIATAATALRQALPRYERNPAGVAWLARLSHALIAVDRAFPVGLQRLVELPWPQDGIQDGPQGADEDVPLTMHLAEENRRLRLEVASRRHQALSAAIGRATVTSVAVALPLVGFFSLVLSLNAESGWEMVGGIVTLSAALIVLLSAAIWILQRYRLLVEWARPVVPYVTNYLEKWFPKMSDGHQGGH